VVAAVAALAFAAVTWLVIDLLERVGFKHRRIIDIVHELVRPRRSTAGV
jgi:hypothetical protein